MTWMTNLNSAAIGFRHSHCNLAVDLGCQFPDKLLPLSHILDGLPGIEQFLAEPIKQKDRFGCFYFHFPLQKFFNVRDLWLFGKFVFQCVFIVVYDGFYCFGPIFLPAIRVYLWHPECYELIKNFIIICLIIDLVCLASILPLLPFLALRGWWPVLALIVLLRDIPPIGW